MFAEVLKKAMTTKENPGDYMKDGVLVCGRCGTPKEVLLSLPALTGTDTPRPFPISCKCQKEADERAENERRAVEFKNNLEARWRADGFHDPSYLKPTFSDDDGANQKLTGVCQKYADRWPEMLGNGMGLLLYGGVGAGKTFLAGCVCNALLKKQVSVCATSFPRVLNVLQNSMDRQKALLELLEDGSWELSCGLSNGKVERSIHPTQEAGCKACEDFMRKRKKGAGEPTLIIIDI